MFWQHELTSIQQVKLPMTAEFSKMAPSRVWECMFFEDINELRVCYSLVMKMIPFIVYQVIRLANMELRHTFLISDNLNNDKKLDLVSISTVNLERYQFF